MGAETQGPRAGLAAAVDLIVTDRDTAIALGSGDVPVLATPRVVALAEQAAVAALRGELPDDRTSVGAWVELSHLRPSRVGATVTAEVKLVRAEGRRLEFDLRVREGEVEVASGRHRRIIVRHADFA